MGVNSLTRDTLTSTVKYTSALAGNSIYDVSAMEPIATAALSGAVNFTSIPQGYQDLMVVISSRDTTASVNTTLFNYLNNDGSSIYSFTIMSGDGSTTSSSRQTGQGVFGAAAQVGASATSGIFSTNIMHILNYSNTTTFKTVLWRSAADANGSGQSRLAVGLYRSTAAITQVYVNPASGFAAGSTATLYGIRAVR
jgi:hypothetical protein